MIPRQGFCVHSHIVTITVCSLRDSLYLSDKYSINGSVRVSVELDLPRSVNYVSIFLSPSTLHPGPTSPSYSVDGPAGFEFRPPSVQGKMILR